MTPLLQQTYCNLPNQPYSRWWFQIFFIFTPSWGRFLFWLMFFYWVETTNQYRTQKVPRHMREWKVTLLPLDFFQSYHTWGSLFGWYMFLGSSPTSSQSVWKPRAARVKLRSLSRKKKNTNQKEVWILKWTGTWDDGIVMVILLVQPTRHALLNIPDTTSKFSVAFLFGGGRGIWTEPILPLPILKPRS